MPPLHAREAVFVSHANPEDNAFATWLTLRLAREGYKMWCDVVKLFGGDDFWRDVENAIRQNTRKFIFVTSRASNQKQGTLQELAVASGVASQLNDTGFIIPVKIDDLPFAEHNIQINRLVAIPFTNGWPEGLGSLLKALDEDAVPKPNAAGPASIASWWNSNRLNAQIVTKNPETLWTNWFPLKEMPKQLFAWQVPLDATLPASFPHPTYRYGDWLFAFANAEELIGKAQSPTGGVGYKIKDYLTHDPPIRMGLKRHEVATTVKQLLRRAWEKLAVERKLPLYDLSSARKTLWFPSGSVSGNTVTFIGVEGKKSRRDVCGYSTKTRLTGDKYKRYWHFGLEAMPILFPSPALALKSHVVFTLDGNNINGDVKAQHRARRNQCKDWWNDKWRDLTLSAVAWLAQGSSAVRLPVSPHGPLMESSPLKHTANVGYRDTDVRPPPAETLAEDRDDEGDNGEDDVGAT
ncbi:MAG: toll/interleukin-1 receptor domain-containing protein [Tepidisphaeraceae bacterium]